MYDIIADIIALPSGDVNSQIVTVSGVLIVIFCVWFLDSLVKLFRI